MRGAAGDTHGFRQTGTGYLIRFPGETWQKGYKISGLVPDICRGRCMKLQIGQDPSEFDALPTSYDARPRVCPPPTTEEPRSHGRENGCPD